LKINNEIATLIATSFFVVDYYQIINQFLIRHPAQKNNCNSFKEIIINEIRSTKILREFIDNIEERTHSSRDSEIHKIKRKLEANIKDLKGKMSNKFWNEYVKQEFEKTLSQKQKEATLYTIHKMNRIINRILLDIFDIFEISKDASIKYTNDEYFILIKRKSKRILDELNVKQEGIVGSSHEFDPTKHEIINGKPANNVVIIEPAIIRLENGNISVIRKAKVKNKEE
jgi:hypothetical protein